MNLPAINSGADLARLDEIQAQALDAIEHVVDPESAERLLAQVKAVDEAVRLARVSGEQEKAWGRIRLLAERRWGELLGPASIGRPSGNVSTGNVSQADRIAQHKAREVASVPEPTFQQYTEQEERPTRTGLLRAADKLAPLMSSATDMWATPQDLFDVLNAEFGFQLDVCATAANAKCPAFYDESIDGLSQPWNGVCWMNPPYGDVIPKWIEKAALSADAGATVVALVPARVDTGWWWTHCRFAEVRFLRGRLKFGGADTGAPFPSAVVVFGRPAAVVWWDQKEELRDAA